jgi:hypothetical protein
MTRESKPSIQSLALRYAFRDVHHDDGAGEFLLSDALGGSGADVAGPDDGDLVDHWSMKCEGGKVVC